MALELVICKHCGFKFRTDIDAQIEDGNATAVKGFLDKYFSKPKTRSVKSIDLSCPNCKKAFDYKVES